MRVTAAGMTATALTPAMTDMARDAPITALVLQEFRLRDEDSAGEAARIIAAFSGGIEPAVPLLVSIDDPRDVATVRAIRRGETPERDPWQRDRLDRLISSWRPLKQYRPRIAERAALPPSSYRLAVTGSGITNGEPDPLAAMPRDLATAGSTTPLGLLWIGVPLATHAGLLVLLGSYGDGHDVRPDASDWPLPLSRYLGVRIYQSLD